MENMKGNTEVFWRGTCRKQTPLPGLERKGVGRMWSFVLQGETCKELEPRSWQMGHWLAGDCAVRALRRSLQHRDPDLLGEGASFLAVVSLRGIMRLV